MSKLLKGLLGIVYEGVMTIDERLWRDSIDARRYLVIATEFDRGAGYHAQPSAGIERGWTSAGYET